MYALSNKYKEWSLCTSEYVYGYKIATHLRFAHLEEEIKAYHVHPKPNLNTLSIIRTSEVGVCNLGLHYVIVNMLSGPTPLYNPFWTG